MKRLRLPGLAAALLGLMGLAGLVGLAGLAGCDRGGREVPGMASSASAAAAEASAPSASAAAAAASGPVLPPTPALAFTDAERSAGATLAANGGNGVAACDSCHGAQGEGNAAAGFPRLAGQGGAYLLTQLQSYADGSRAHPVMGPIATAMSPAQRRASAAHYAAHYAALGAQAVAAAGSAAATPAANRADADPGRRLAEVGDDARLLQACANCHGRDGGGLGDSIPSLAGQHAGYLRSALAAWRDGSRHNDETGQMPAIARALTDGDVRVLSAWYAAMPPVAAGAVPASGGQGVAYASALPAVVSGPRAASGASAAAGAGQQGVGSEQGAPLTGGGVGAGGGGATGAPAATGASPGAAQGATAPR